MLDGANTLSPKAAETRRRAPELLCPAGSPAAFDAAIEAGADAIYMGGVSFNARINAKNFNAEEMRDAIRRAHAYGVKVYITANTLIYDREAEAYLRSAEEAYLAGADALIVADVGAGALIKKYIPELEIHASTQLSGHNVEAAKKLAELGFSRMVCAREMSADDLRAFTADSPIEAEVFVHGALCVCHSGQCLFSSMVGGRSGNRGECAQPCRLPYKVNGKERYPLSLKDLSLAAYVPELRDMGIASFKIEGRMKSPEYVRDVGRIWRRLIDENRGATAQEMSELERIFSRGGFTDGYYKKRIDRNMMGVRSEGDKQTSRELTAFDKITRKIPLDMSFSMKKGVPITLSADNYGISVSGDIPEMAKTAPLDKESVLRSLSKLGSTPYALRGFVADIDDGLMLPVSKLNALRRALTDELERGNGCARVLPERAEDARWEKAKGERKRFVSAVFYNVETVTEKAKEYFDVIYTPLEDYSGETNGVLLPAVIYDSEVEKISKLLTHAKERGAIHALVGNLGHLELVKSSGLIPHGDLRLNVTNNGTAAVLEGLGFEDVILSPELTLARMRDIGGRSVAAVYGRLPLMVTEKCVGREIGSCRDCDSKKLKLTDRKNTEFPVYRDAAHRSLIFNSVPTFMADRKAELERANIKMWHFIFTDETPKQVDAVIEMYKKGMPLGKPSRRI